MEYSCVKLGERGVCWVVGLPGYCIYIFRTCINIHDRLG